MARKGNGGQRSQPHHFVAPWQFAAAPARANAKPIRESKATPKTRHGDSAGADAPAARRQTAAKRRPLLPAPERGQAVEGRRPEEAAGAGARPPRLGQPGPHDSSAAPQGPTRVTRSSGPENCLGAQRRRPWQLCRRVARGVRQAFQRAGLGRPVHRDGHFSVPQERAGRQSAGRPKGTRLRATRGTARAGRRNAGPCQPGQ